MEDASKSVPDRDTGGNDKSSYHTEQPGQIDLVGLFQLSNTTPQLDDDLVEATQADISTDIFPEDRRFQYPKTPATNGKKRDRDGNAIEHLFTTPRLPVNPFASRIGATDAGVMGLSQVFKATQAPTSPLPNAVPSDASERPSPNLYNINGRISHELQSDMVPEKTSPNFQRPPAKSPSSSPPAFRPTPFNRFRRAPYPTYITMKESQEARDRRMEKEERGSRPLSADEIFEMEGDVPIADGQVGRRRASFTEDLRVERRRRANFMEAIPAATNRERPRSSGGIRAGKSTPGREHLQSSPSRGRTQNAVAISDDAEANETEDETEHEDPQVASEMDPADEFGEEDKENTEARRRQIPTSRSASTPKSRIARRLLQPSPAISRRRQSTDNGPVNELADESPSQSPASPVQRPSGNAVAVADSQASRSGRAKRHAAGQPTPESSNGSRKVIPQSQSSKIPNTSQLDSSIARRELAMSSQHTLSPPPSSPTEKISSSPTIQRKAIQRNSAQIPTTVIGNSPPKVSKPPKATLALVVNGLRGGADRPGSDGDYDASSDPHLAASSEANELDRHSRQMPATNTDQTPLPQRAGNINTIPETDCAPRHLSRQASEPHPSGSGNSSLQKILSDASALHKTANETTRSNNSTVFESAPSHPSKSQEKSHDQRSPRTPQRGSPTQPKFRKPKAFTEIEKDCPVSNELNDVDIDVGLFTAEDLEFNAQMAQLEGSSPVAPARKRRRGAIGRTIPVQDQAPTSSPNAQSAPATLSKDGNNHDEPQFDVQALEPSVNRQSSGVAEFRPMQTAVQKFREEQGRKARARHSHQPHSTSPNARNFSKTTSVHTATPEQMLVETAAADSTLPKSAPNAATEVTGTDMAGTLRSMQPPADHIFLPQNVPSKSTKGMGKASARSHSSTDKVPKEQDARPKAAGPRADERVGRAGVQPRRSTDKVAVDMSARAPKGGSGMIVPTRVFAYFNGSPAGYFPATCLAVVAGEDHKLRIRFDDGTITTVGESNVKRLELQKGDSVKVFREGLRAHTYLVQELHDKVTNDLPESERNAIVTDVLGHRTVSLRPKQKRGKQDQVKEEVVPVAEIYQTSTIWSSFKDRPYTHPFSAAESAVPITPSEQLSPPSTPGSRLRLHAGTRTSSVQKLAAPSKSSRNSSGLFSNLVFAITEIPHDQLREHTEALVRKHGGLILKDGFHELFDVPAAVHLPSASLPPSSAASSTSDRNSPSDFQSSPSVKGSGASQFALKPSLHPNGAVLLADRHCRKSKFFQALALGVPCLATRWVTDSIAVGKLCDWRHYLLASGESSFLGGAVCSRTLNYAGNPGNKTLELREMMDLREKWLQDKRVLLVGPAHQTGAYAFIAFALGAQDVGVTQSTEEARSVLENAAGKVSEAGRRGGWDWVCVHEEDRATGEDAKDVETSGKRKRKRESEGGGARKKRKAQGDAALASDCLKGFDGVKVVGTEYVVQSLILGRLLDEM